MELSELLRNVLKNSYLFPAGVSFSFECLYYLGIRHNELNISNLTPNTQNQLIIQPSKKSNQRIINLAELPEKFVFKLYNLIDNKIITCRATLSQYFNNCSYPYRITNKSKGIRLHSFRYNYIRQYYNNCLSIEQTQAHIGHKDIKNTHLYINNVLSINSLKQY